MVQITRLGHSTFSFRLDTGEVYVIDPWVEGNPRFPKDYQFDRVDGILITHLMDTLTILAEFMRSPYG